MRSWKLPCIGLGLCLANAVAGAQDAPAQPVPGQPVIGPDFGVFGPFAVETNTPDYPAAAMEACLNGYALVQLDVLTDGRAVNVQVRQAEPAGVFEQAALDAISGWSFAPRRVDGVLAPARVQQVFAFRAPPPCPQIDQSGEQLDKCQTETPERYGVVSLDLILNADGTPQNIEVASSTHAFMNDGVVESARTWQYEPGEPGRTMKDQKVEFCLKEDAGGSQR